MDQLIPAIKQIVAFYESPVRKKLAAATSSMTSEGAGWAAARHGDRPGDDAGDAAVGL